MDWFSSHERVKDAVTRVDIGQLPARSERRAANIFIRHGGTEHLPVPPRCAKLVKRRQCYYPVLRDDDGVPTSRFCFLHGRPPTRFLTAGKIIFGATVIDDVLLAEARREVAYRLREFGDWREALEDLAALDHEKAETMANRLKEMIAEAGLL